MITILADSLYFNGSFDSPDSVTIES